MLLNYSHFTKTCNKMFVSNVTIRSEFLSLNHWHFQACFLLGTTFIATLSVIFIPETPAFQEVKILLKHYELNFNSLSVTKSKQTSCLFIDHEMRENNRQNSFLTLGTHMKHQFVAFNAYLISQLSNRSLRYQISFVCKTTARGRLIDHSSAS